MAGKVLMVQARVDPATKARLKKLAKNLSPQEFKKFARKAMRNMSTEVKADLKGNLEDRYRLGAVGGFSRIARTRSRMADDGLEMKVRGSRIALAKFMTAKGDGMETPPSVDVVGAKQMRPGDFYARVNVRARARDGIASHRDMIFRPEEGTYNQRYKLGKVASYKGRGKIKGLMTVSVPNMMNQDQVKQNILKSAGARAEEALMKAVDKAFRSAT